MAFNPEKVAVVADPVIVAPPGMAVTTHGLAGNPLKITDPVGVAHVGWVTIPTTGAEGVTGWALIVTLVEDAEVHPEEVRVTVKV